MSDREPNSLKTRLHDSGSQTITTTVTSIVKQNVQIHRLKVPIDMVSGTKKIPTTFLKDSKICWLPEDRGSATVILTYLDGNFQPEKFY